MTTAGVKLPLPLSHGLLAGIVGARRPTVSTALGALRDQGLVERTEGGWLLHGDPPGELHDLRLRVARARADDRAAVPALRPLIGGLLTGGLIGHLPAAWEAASQNPALP